MLAVKTFQQSCISMPRGHTESSYFVDVRIQSEPSASINENNMLIPCNTLSNTSDEEQKDQKEDQSTTELTSQDIFCESVELVLNMMSFLDPLELARVTRVCQQWRILGRDHTLWKKLVTEYKYPLNSNAVSPNSNWQEVWKWFYSCGKKIFDDNEEKNGIGSYSWSSNGSRYEGEWKNNKESGRGTKFWPDGATFEGEWKDSKFNGFGKHTWASGSSYEGNWISHKRNGFGKNTWVQKDRFEGDWVDDQKHGYGIYIWCDGRKYEGAWSNDKRSGYGVFTWPKLACKYEGQWKDDNRHGFGKFIWKDKDQYEGEWIQGKRFGKGRLTTASGKVFEQEWREVDEFDASNKGDIDIDTNQSQNLITSTILSTLLHVSQIQGQGISVSKRKLSSEDDIIDFNMNADIDSITVSSDPLLTEEIKRRKL